MQKIFVATDRNGKVYPYTDKPVWQDSSGTFAGHWRFVDCEPSFAPPPGECREYRIVPADGTDDKDARIAELEKQLAERSPGVMPDVAEKMLGYLGRGDVPPQDVERDFRSHFAPPDGYEWRRVTENDPITAADVGRKVARKNGGVDEISGVSGGFVHFHDTEVRNYQSGRIFECRASGFDITHILRPIAKPFVFDGTPGIYRTDSGKCCDVFRYGKKLLGIIDDSDRVWVNADGTFDGGAITGRVGP